ncbi:hypothetical protein JOM56_003789 [Amanita muscaria]
MSTGDTPLRRPRKDARYNAEELKAIQPFKEVFVSERSKPSRLKIFQNDILPALFNYWESVGKGPVDKIESCLRAKELASWLTNNWQVRKGIARKSNGFRVKRSNAIWMLYEDRVWEEIASLLGVEEANSSTLGWFGMRIRALQNIHRKMSEAEKAKVDEEVEKMSRKGYPDEVKRRLAEKYSWKRIHNSDQEHWKELGLLSVTFTAHTRPDGQLVVNVHDHIADLMSVAAQPFLEVYKDNVTNMKRQLMEYMRTLRPPANPILREAVIFNISEDGFPILPVSWDGLKHNKDKLEQYFKLYLSQHYKLATNYGSQHVPFKSIAENLSSYTSPEYLPSDLQMTNPRNMRKKAIQEFFEHVSERQNVHGIKQAFRFKMVKSGNQMVPAKYPNDAGAGADNNNTLASKRPRKGKVVAGPTGQPNHKESYLDDVNAVSDADAGADSDVPLADLRKGLRKTKAVTGPTYQLNHVESDLDNAGANADTDSVAAQGSLSALADPQTKQFVLVGQSVIGKLTKAGIPMPVPVPFNGPVDGDPQYFIDAEIYQQFMQDEQYPPFTVQLIADEVIDPMLLHMVPPMVGEIRLPQAPGSASDNIPVKQPKPKTVTAENIALAPASCMDSNPVKQPKPRRVTAKNAAPGPGPGPTLGTGSNPVTQPKPKTVTAESLAPGPGPAPTSGMESNPVKQPKPKRVTADDLALKEAEETIGRSKRRGAKLVVS